MMNCSILDFDARVTDALQTKQIQAAIDACFLAGGGTVTIPAGVFRTGGIRLRSNVTLYLERGAILEASQDPEDYSDYLLDSIEPISQGELDTYRKVGISASPFSRWSNGLIRAIHAKDIAIIGEEFSWIDGMNCYDETGEEDYRGPHVISIHFCENVTLKGYSIHRSGNWGHAIFDSKNIVADSVTVLGGHDGFDIRSCDNVVIENCYFDTGDDCVAGFDNNDVIVRNCLLGSSSNLFRFGGNNVLFENCRSLNGGSFGHRGNMSPSKKQQGASSGTEQPHRTSACFMYYCDFRANISRPVENILVRNCEFGEMMTIFSQNWNENYIWCCNRPLQQIKFENCKFNSVSDSIYIHASAEEPMLFEMEKCDITVRPGYENIAFLHGIDFGTVHMTNVRLHGFTNPRIVKHTSGSVRLENCTDIDIIEDYNPEFRGTCRDHVITTNNGLLSLENGCYVRHQSEDL